ncbi:MAG: hypothetical protein HOV94_04680, partial [Saccharothrix sp.]|nr:hypothetical protein [Saccharothrix sp.]
WTMDTAIDASGWDAVMRAAPYLAPDYLEVQRANPPERSPGGEWLTWAEHRAYTTVVLTSADESGKPPDTLYQAYHAWTVTVTVHGRDGWTGQSPDQTVFVVLQRSDPAGDWKVAGFEVR